MIMRIYIIKIKVLLYSSLSKNITSIYLKVSSKIKSQLTYIYPNKSIHGYLSKAFCIEYQFFLLSLIIYTNKTLPMSTMSCSGV